jgi:hypothetical protein
MSAGVKTGFLGRRIRSRIDFSEILAQRHHRPCLERAKVTVETVDSVLMTRGTSYVPAVRRLFEQRFGHEKLRYGDAFARRPFRPTDREKLNDIRNRAVSLCHCAKAA